MPPNGVEKKLKVLVLAEAANPEFTSVPLLGWLHAYALSKKFDVHLVTQVRNKAAIERLGWKDGKEFTAIDTEKIAAPFYKLSGLLRGGSNKGWTIDTAIASLSYPYFEYRCWQIFKDKLVSGDFDLVHRITPVSPTASSYIAKKLHKINVPFVIGPLNGGVPWPKEFINLQHKEKEWLSHIRDVYKLLPGYKSTRKYASCILAGSMATKAQMPEYISEKLLYIPENAVDPARFNLTNESEYTFPLKAAFVGRLVPYKGADMAIEAMAELCKQGKMTYDIYGDGPELPALKSLIANLGLEKFVTIHGFVDNACLQQQLVKADLLVFPSVREFGGGVVLESMALGVVPVIADYAGPSELISDKEGFLVPLGNRDQLISNLRTTLESICSSPLGLKEKRSAALDKVSRFYTWEKKASQVERVYNWVLGRDKRPDFTKPFK